MVFIVPPGKNIVYYLYYITDGKGIKMFFGREKKKCNFFILCIVKVKKMRYNK